jgi:hypothetical protein
MVTLNIYIIIVINIIILFIIYNVYYNENFRVGPRGGPHGIVHGGLARSRYGRMYGTGGIDHIVHRGYSPTIIETGYSLPYYYDYQLEPMSLRFHYDDTSPAYIIWEPIWRRLKEELQMSSMNIKFSENNENINTTIGLSKIPLIVRVKSGVSEEYKGPAEYVQLRNWALAAY